MAATLAPYKPAAQIDFTNQVIIPDLDLPDLLKFIDLFRQMQHREAGERLTRHLKPGKRNYRPPLYSGNFPDAPPNPIFGAVGLVGAMGRWVQRAEDVSWARDVVKKLAERPLYLVSYDQSLFRQVHLGHHVAELALRYDVPEALRGLYRTQFYNADDNKIDSKSRQLFFEMASRFLRLYTRSAFRDFLSFRVQYEASFLPILEDYFMQQRSLSTDLVRSARAYGAHLNYVAYRIADDEVKENERREGGGTRRNVYEAKARALAQMESTAMSAKSSSALFARLNVDAGRRSNRDVPVEAERFMEASISGEIPLDTSKELILAFMRLRSQDESQAATTSHDAKQVMMED